MQLIDWFTVAAQIINFLVLLWLLKRFLYQPILNTLEQRQQQLTDRWDAAETEKQRAIAAEKDHRQAQRELAETREQRLQQVRAEAEQLRQDLMQRAREEVAQMRTQWEQGLADEQAAFLSAVQQQLTQQVVAIARQVLQDLANAELEQQTVATFTQQLRSLTADAQQELTQALQDNADPVVVQTHFELPDAQRQAIMEALQATAAINGQAVEFQQDADLIFGVQLQNGSYTIGWTADEYLRHLVQDMAQTIQPQTDAAPAAA